MIHGPNSIQGILKKAGSIGHTLTNAARVGSEDYNLARIGKRQLGFGLVSKYSEAHPTLDNCMVAGLVLGTL